jgi:DME family drug/metabolite transporter
MRGYVLVLLAAVFWGISGVAAKWIFISGVATPLTVSQTRVLVGWLAFLAAGLVGHPRDLAVAPRDLWRFFLLGVIGVAGANFGLYFAISRMDAALADLIQFTAPAMVALWMWMRHEEDLSRHKLSALVLTTIGVTLALGIAERHVRVSAVGALSAFGSALSYAFLMVWGKHLSRRYSQLVSLHYAMLSAALFWFALQSPARLLEAVHGPQTALLLAGFGVISVVIPYSCFFAGLRRVPASGAGIASTLEPVVMAIGAHLALAENLTVTQIAGVALVLLGIVVMELDRTAREP